MYTPISPSTLTLIVFPTLCLDAKVLSIVWLHMLEYFLYEYRKYATITVQCFPGEPCLVKAKSKVRIKIRVMGCKGYRSRQIRVRVRVTLGDMRFKP